MSIAHAQADLKFLQDYKVMLEKRDKEVKSFGGLPLSPSGLPSPLLLRPPLRDADRKEFQRYETWYSNLKTAFNIWEQKHMEEVNASPFSDIKTKFTEIDNLRIQLKDDFPQTELKCALPSPSAIQQVETKQLIQSRHFLTKLTDQIERWISSDVYEQLPSGTIQRSGSLVPGGATDRTVVGLIASIENQFYMHQYIRDHLYWLNNIQLLEISSMMNISGDVSRLASLKRRIECLMDEKIPLVIYVHESVDMILLNASTRSHFEVLIDLCKSLKQKEEYKNKARIVILGQVKEFSQLKQVPDLASSGYKWSSMFSPLPHALNPVEPPGDVKDSQLACPRKVMVDFFVNPLPDWNERVAFLCESLYEYNQRAYAMNPSQISMGASTSSAIGAPASSSSSTSSASTPSSPSIPPQPSVVPNDQWNRIFLDYASKRMNPEWKASSVTLVFDLLNWLGSADPQTSFSELKLDLKNVPILNDQYGFFHFPCSLTFLREHALPYLLEASYGRMASNKYYERERKTTSAEQKEHLAYLERYPELKQRAMNDISGTAKILMARQHPVFWQDKDFKQYERDVALTLVENFAKKAPLQELPLRLMTTQIQMLHLWSILQVPNRVAFKDVNLPRKAFIDEANVKKVLTPAQTGEWTTSDASDMWSL